MIRTLTTLTSVLLDRLETIEARVENLRLAHGCAGDACAVCASSTTSPSPTALRGTDTATCVIPILRRSAKLGGRCLVGGRRTPRNEE